MQKLKSLAILSASAFLTIGLAACGDDNSSSSSSNNQSSISQVSSSKKENEPDPTKTVYQIGQTANYKGIELKVNSIKYSQGDDVETPDNGKQYAIVSVTMTNNSDKSLDYNELDFAFDCNGDSKDPETVSLNGINEMNSGSLDKGASITKDLVGQVPLQLQNNKLLLTYQPDSLNDNLKIKFQLN